MVAAIACSTALELNCEQGDRVALRNGRSFMQQLMSSQYMLFWWAVRMRHISRAVLGWELPASSCRPSSALLAGVFRVWHCNQLSIWVSLKSLTFIFLLVWQCELCCSWYWKKISQRSCWVPRGAVWQIVLNQKCSQWGAWTRLVLCQPFLTDQRGGKILLKSVFLCYAILFRSVEELYRSRWKGRVLCDLCGC